MRAATAAFLDRVVAEAARPVELLSVSFGPSAGPDWSVRVMVEDVGPMIGDHERNGRSSFREGTR